ncbi:ribose transporter RbsU, partial [Staphylococcus aureus]
MTVWSERKEASNAKNLRRAVVLLFIGEFGYWLYSAAPQATSIDGLTAFLPQAMGMVIVAVIYGFMNMKAENPLLNKITWVKIISGIFVAFGALTYLISAQPNMNGLATGLILSQTSVVLPTTTGIYFFKQNQNSNEMLITIIGLLLILVAASVT